MIFEIAIGVVLGVLLVPVLLAGVWWLFCGVASLWASLWDVGWPLQFTLRAPKVVPIKPEFKDLAEYLDWANRRGFWEDGTTGSVSATGRRRAGE